MQRRLLLSAFLILGAAFLPPPHHLAGDIAPTPPTAAERPVRHVIHGIERIDPYAWLRDDNWGEVRRDPSLLDPEIRAHIEAENRYAERVLAPLAGLRVKLLEELKGRIEQDQADPPVAHGPYLYWTRYRPGAEHEQVLRAPRSGGPEEVLLDGPALAAGKEYFTLGDHEHSPDHRLYAYLTDELGSENHRLRVRDLATGRDLPEVLGDVSSFAWSSDSGTLFYVKLDAEHRPRYVYRHRLGTEPAEDVLVYREDDLGFEVSVESTATQRYVVITASNSDTSEQWLVDSIRPESAPVVVAARQPNVRYRVHDWGDRLVIRTNAAGADDFKIVTAPAATPGRDNWRDLVPHRAGRRIVEIVALAGHVARLEREDGLERLVIRRKSDGSEHTVEFGEEAYALELAAAHEYDTTILRFSYSSPTTPSRTFDYDAETQVRTLRKEQQVPSGHDPSAYVVRRIDVATADEEKVPITVLHRKGLRLDRSAPLFLEGYGAYSFAFRASFDANLFSLVDRGFVYAIAHVRGGLEKGERWRNAGRLHNKRNSFSDFIAAAEHLIASGYTSAGRIVARGDSAGGLLVGAVANQRPDLFAGIIARVPFVDALNSTLDESLPLTAGDFTEWGDPIRDAAAYRTIAAYSPYDNVAHLPYPHFLVTAGLRDHRVPYWEPAKWVAKLRAMTTSDARIVLATNMSAGHFDVPGRFASLQETAMLQAFALEAAGLRPADAVAGEAPSPAEAINPTAGETRAPRGAPARVNGEGTGR
jgi:oligopeptidase B